MKPNKISLIVALVAGIFLLSNTRVFGQQYTLSPSGNICGTTTTLTMSGSQSGVAYQLETSTSTGTLLVGSAKTGTGSALTWTNVPVPSGNTYVVLTGSTVAAVTYLNQIPPIAGNVTSSNIGGGSVKFTVNITQGTAVNYEWFNGGPPISSGASASTYTATVPGNYTVLVISSCGSVMLTCPIVMSPGTISPVAQTMTNSGTAQALTSTAATGGNGIYTYQWQSSTNNSTWTPINGATQLTYTPQNQIISTYYRLVATSNGVSLPSNPALVNTMISSSYSSSNNIVSVNESTGTANVIIPLHTIQAAHVNFPINLIYSATGVKASDNEQNAGMGWNVSLGGAVTRQLRGLPDDVSKDSKGNVALGWLYANNGPTINNSSFSNDNNTATCSDETTDIEWLSANFSANADTEPDIFQVNAPGLSCQLVFDKNNVLRVIPYQDLKISYTTSAQGNTDQGQINSFTITNDQGITYTFGAVSDITQIATTTQSSVNYLQSNYNHYKNGISYHNSWSLTQISDVHNNGIIITYKPAPGVEFSNPVQLSTGGAALTTLYTMKGSMNSLLPATIYSQNSLSSPGKLISINYWHTPTNLACITDIQFLGHDIIFGYSGASSAGYIRQFLTSIVDQTCSAQTVSGQTYALSSYAPLNLTFNYVGNNAANSTSGLASPTQNNVDYWGYTNLIPTNTSLLPSIDINPSTAGYERYRNRQSTPSPTSIYAYAINSANRQADQSCTMGTLSQINYSEGGYTALSYEPNQYYDNTLQANIIGGGIRVTQVLDHDGINTDNDFVKTYTYRNLSNGVSTGKAISLPVFVFTTPYSGTNTGAALWTSSTMMSPFDLSGEDHTILYSAVTETINNTGTTVYQYAIPGTNWDTSAPVNPIWSPTGLPAWNQTMVDVGRFENVDHSCPAEGILKNDVNTYPFPPNTNYDFERGLLTNVSKYNNTGTQVSETDYYYQTPEAPVDITALKYDVNSLATNYAKYIIHTSVGPLLTQTVNKLFDLTNVSPGTQPTVAQVVTTNKAYNTAQHKLNSQTTINADGSSNTINIKYSKDYLITTANDSYTSNILALQNENLNIPVETYTQFTPVNGTQVTTGGDLTLFGTFPNQGADFSQYITGSNIQTIVQVPGTAPLQHRKFISVNGVPGNGAPAFVPSSISSSNTFQYDSRYIVTENDLSYDYSGFLNSKDDGFQHVTTTLYDNLNTYRLMALIKNATDDQVGAGFILEPFSIIYNPPPNAYNFPVIPTGLGSALTNSTVTRNGEQAIALPASTFLTKSVNKNTAAKNYIFSTWVNVPTAGGYITATATDGTNTISKQIPFNATVSNTSPLAGFQYCQAVIPVTTLTASSTIRISFSSNQNINCTDMLTYPDVADIITYSYDSNNNKIAETNGNGVSTYYSYDALGRVLYVYDQDDNIIERKTYVNSNPAINSSPSVNLSWSSKGGYVESAELIQFSTGITGNNTCTFDGNLAYTWHFGDGTIQLGNSPSHVYSGSKGQKFTATLTITSSDKSATPYSTSTVVTL